MIDAFMCLLQEAGCCKMLEVLRTYKMVPALLLSNCLVLCFKAVTKTDCKALVNFCPDLICLFSLVK